MVRQWQEVFYGGRYYATPLANPDFVQLARAYGFEASAVAARADVIPAVEARTRQSADARDRVPGAPRGLRVPDRCRPAPN